MRSLRHPEPFPSSRPKGLPKSKAQTAKPATKANGISPALLRELRDSLPQDKYQETLILIRESKRQVQGDDKSAENGDADDNSLRASQDQAASTQDEKKNPADAASNEPEIETSRQPKS